MKTPLLLLAYLNHFTYAGMFIVLLLSGYVIPVPEEIVLLIIGYAIREGIGQLGIALAVCIVAVICGDNIIYWMSRTGNRLVIGLLERISQRKIHYFKRLMHGHAAKALIVMRFVPTLRFLAPVLAGSLKVKYRKFAIYNSIAVTIFVPIVILIGYFFHDNVEGLLANPTLLKHVLFGMMLILLAVIASYVIRKAGFIRKRAAALKRVTTLDK